MLQLTIKRLCEPNEKANACAAILSALPQWFGIPEANASYIEHVRNIVFFAVAYDWDKAIGFIALETGTDAAEIHVMGVLPEYHRQGIGRQLVQRCEEYCIARKIAVTTVKTLGPAHPDAGYARTRAFYEGMGFEAVRVTEEWGKGCPCLHMAKRLKGGNP